MVCSVKRVEMLEVADFDEVWQHEKVDEALFLVALLHSVLINLLRRRNNIQNLMRSMTVHLIVIVEVEDIGEERLGLHRLKRAIAVVVVLVEDDPDVTGAIKSPLVACFIQPLLIIVEDISQEEIGEEVEAGEHEEHEEEGVEEVHALGGQEHIRIVRRREQNRQVAVRVADRAKVLNAFERRAVEVVAGEDEDEDVGEDGDKDSAGLVQVLEEAHH